MQERTPMNVLVIDMYPQANCSSMLLGGMIDGETHLDEIAIASPRLTIAGYIEARIQSPYSSPQVGASYPMRIRQFNNMVPQNLYLVVGDEELELQASRVARATVPGPPDAWRIVHTWITDLIADIRHSWNLTDSTVFIDCNPSFTIYTEIALSAAERLIVPFSADGSSKRAVRAVLSLVYGIARSPGGAQSEFYLNSQRWLMRVPEIYCYVGNRLTQMNNSSASAFKTVVTSIGTEIWNVWRSNPNHFCIHPSGASAPSNRVDFRRMFQAEINDANTASVISGALGIPMAVLTPGPKILAERSIPVNQ